MSTLTYTKFELKRTFRNKRTFIFTLIFPLLMYFLIATPNRGKADFVRHYGVSAPLYFMVGLAGFGAMIAALAGGVRIAAERQVGWNRQLRLTPLTPRQYFRTKIVTSYAMVLISLVLLYVAGVILGVRMPASQWLHMTALILVSLIPFAGLGIGLGHLLTADAMGPAMGGGTSLFAFLGGTWFPINGNGAFAEFCKSLPSYWLTRAGRVGLGGKSDPWGAHGWIVIAIWSLAGAAFAMWAYRRDTARV